MSFFTGLWPLVSHITGAGLVIAGLIAAAVFSPVFKREFAYAAAAVALGLFVYTVGVRDEKHRRDAQEAAAQTDVDDAVKHSTGKKDPFDDPRL